MFKIDLSYLETIAGGDRSFIKEMLTMLLSTTFTEMDNIKREAAAGQWAELGSLAHKIKAPVQMLGVPVISDLILEIEQQGKHLDHTETISAKVTELDTYMAELKSQVEEVLKGYE
jgi:HPt (histidine-containing phosphotransfer) domain-containing protein